MVNKVAIDVEAKFDSAGVDAGVQKLTQKINQANKTQYNPISDKAGKAVSEMDKKLQQLLRVDTELRRRMKATGQSGTAFEDLDLKAMYPDAGSRKRKQDAINRYVGAPTSGPGGQQGGGGGGFGRMAAGAAQAGLKAAGPAGGVAANAVGTGMSAGIGAGLMGLMGGMLALGVGKLVSAGLEKIEQAEKNNVGMDTLKRQLGDVNVSFNALKKVVNSSADNLKITYDEAGRLSSQFVKLGNVSGSQYKTIKDELNVGVGMSRAFGMDPSAGVGAMGQMRGVGMTSSVQESKKFALIIGETIGKSNAFAKSEEVMDALANFAVSQTRNNMGRANVAGYGGMLSGMVSSGIPGMDVAGSSALLGRVNASLSSGGAHGEASQFFTGQIGARMGLDPYQTQILREGGAFATNDEAFGKGSAAQRFGISGPGGNKTFLQSSLDALRGQYGGNKGQLAQATSNHLGINMRQAMGLLSVNPNEIGEMQKYGDLSKLSGSGIGNLSKALYGSSDERAGLGRSLMGRKDVSQDDKNELKAAMGTPAEREVLAKLTAQYDQERTQGSDIRDSKNLLDNLKTSVADKMVPLMTDMRLGILNIAGGGKKSSNDVMRNILGLESADRREAINGKFATEEDALKKQMKQVNAEKAQRSQHINQWMGDPKMAEKVREYDAGEAKKRLDIENRLAAIQKEKADMLEDENKLHKKNLAQLNADTQDKVFTGAGTGGGAGAVGGAPGSGGSAGAKGGGPGDYDAMFVKYGKQYGVDPRVLKAIAMKESGMHPDAVGAANKNGTRDYGLMQHNSAYLGERGLRDDWKNPERSIEEAAKLLSANIQKTGSVRSGVRAYNGSGKDAEAYAADIMGRVEGTQLNAAGTPLPPTGAGAGRGAGSDHRISIEPLTVVHQDSSGREIAPSQQLQPKVQSNWRASMGY